jgi:myo-inositol-1(or 4)-monophosphatase
VPKSNPAVRRRLAGVPHAVAGRGAWETRKTGSAAIECAFVAAGLLEAAFLRAPNLWDVAGGVALVNASGGKVLATHGAAWDPFERFEPPPADGELNLRQWKRSLIIGRGSAEGLARGTAYLE